MTRGQEISIYEMKNYMRNTLLRDSDVVSMAHSLEVRPPLLDHELAKLVLELPDHYKIDEDRKKKIFVDAVKDLLPKNVVEGTKRGFELPYAHWMNGPLNTIIMKAWNNENACDIYQSAFQNRMRKKASEHCLTRKDWLPCVTLLWYLHQLDKKN